MTRIISFCRCGAKLDVSDLDHARALAAQSQWRGLHSGGGCGSATRDAAKAARRRKP